MGHHSLTGASEENWLITYQTLSSMIGSAWGKYLEWEAINPQELIAGGTYDGTLLWKRNLPEYIAVDLGLCGQCKIATLARQFLFKADLSAFRSVWRQGIVYGINMATTPWSPQLYDVPDQALPPYSAYYEDLDANYHLALNYYDEVVGPSEH